MNLKLMERSLYNLLYQGIRAREASCSVTNQTGDAVSHWSVGYYEFADLLTALHDVERLMRPESGVSVEDFADALREMIGLSETYLVSPLEIVASRRAEMIEARRVLATSLAARGWRPEAIGTFLGRDESNVRHLLKRGDGSDAR